MATTIKNEIYDILKKNRPTLSDSSLKTYSSTLTALYNNMKRWLTVLRHGMQEGAGTVGTESVRVLSVCACAPWRGEGFFFSVVGSLR